MQLRGRAFGIVERLGDDDRDRLAVEAHFIVLQHVQPLADRGVDRALVIAISKARRVEMADDRDDARQCARPPPSRSRRRDRGRPWR